MADPWPLSAAATAVLRDPTIAHDDVLRLALKELVLRRAWRIEQREQAGRLRTRTRVHLREGAAGPPALAPLPELHAALREVVGADGHPLDRTAASLRSVWDDVPRTLHRAAQADLVDRGLAESTRDRLLGIVPRTRLRRTPRGEALAKASHEREQGLRALLAGGDAAAASAALAAAGGLILLAAPELAGEIEAFFARAAAGGDRGGGGVAGDDDGGTVDGISLPELSLLDAVDPGIDAAFDAGGGGGGGDGGGGDGGS